MEDQSILSTLLVIFVPAMVLTALVVWQDGIQQKKEKNWQVGHDH